MKYKRKGSNVAQIQKTCARGEMTALLKLQCINDKNRYGYPDKYQYFEIILVTSENSGNKKIGYYTNCSCNIQITQ